MCEPNANHPFEPDNGPVLEIADTVIESINARNYRAALNSAEILCAALRMLAEPTKELDGPLE